MSAGTRPVATHVTLCDLCDQVIPEIAEAAEKGSLTHGYIAHRVHAGPSGRTKHAWLIWPRKKRLGPHVIERHYDFHAECIGALVEANSVKRGRS